LSVTDKVGLYVLCDLKRGKAEKKGIELDIDKSRGPLTVSKKEAKTVADSKVQKDALNGKMNPQTKGSNL